LFRVWPVDGVGGARPFSNQLARIAVDPTNAILNYAYGVLEARCRQALAAEGLDMACGFLHADKQYRDSLVYDLMELYRPAVDALVLALLGRTTFAYSDLVLTHEGRCRLHAQLARAVAAGCRVEQGRVSEGAGQLRELLRRARATSAVSRASCLGNTVAQTMVFCV
jgi:CRISPR-associated endonuclease Cas1